MKLFVIAIVSFLAGAAVSGVYFSQKESDAAEFAASAFAVTTGTYVLTFVDSLQRLREHDVAKAITILEPRLKRDLIFLQEAAVESEIVARAVNAAEAYQTEFSGSN